MSRGLRPAGRRAVTLAVLAAAACGCETIRGDYMPLEVGNRWEYAVSSQRGEAAPRSSADFIEIIEKLGPTTYRAREFGVSSVWSKEHGLLLRSDGQWREAMLAFPPHTGYRWRVNTNSGSRFYEIAGRESVTVPAGTFPQCVKVSCRDRSGRRVTYFYFAPGVGLVRKVRLYGGRPYETRSLVRCRLKTPPPAPPAPAGRGESAGASTAPPAPAPAPGPEPEPGLLTP